MGTAVGEGIVTAAQLAVVQDAPLVTIPASGGARMQEGILSLMQMARTTVAVGRVREKGLSLYRCFDRSDNRRSHGQFCDVRGYSHC